MHPLSPTKSSFYGQHHGPQVFLRRLKYSPYNTKIIDTHPSISGTTDRVVRHGLYKLCEILCRQLDVTCRTVLEGAFGISVQNRRTISETSVVAAQYALETHELPGMGTTLGPIDATQAIHNWAGVKPFLAAIASIAETRAKL